MAERVDRAERLLNLVFALMATPRAVPRSVIREQVPGYGDVSSDSSFERMFERDKDELRSMGIPVETIQDEFGEVQGYRITRDAYAMPPMELSVEERSAITVAAQVWGHAQVAPVAGTAVRKLQSVTSDGDAWGPADLQGVVQLTSSDAALLPLMTAIRTGHVVTFDYRAPSASTASRRTVSPWSLSTREGHWMLQGHDHDRDAQRTFRVSRISGPITVTSIVRTEPQPLASAPADEEETPYRARVRADLGQAARLRQAAVTPAADGLEFDVEVGSLDALVAMVCGAAGKAVVMSPPEAVSAVVAAWRALAADHGTGE